MGHREFIPNELYRDLLGVNGLNPFKQNNSSSREQMFSSHIGQTLVVDGATERYIQTGMEREYGKYTFSIKMPCDAEIIKVVDRYPTHKHLDDPIKLNPQSVIIYQNVMSKDREVGMLSVPNFCSYHQYFGFRYARQPGANLIKPKSAVPKDTIIMDSPSVRADGGYAFGVQCNVVYMSHPAVAEDGIVICRDVLPKFKFRTYEVRTVEWGSKRFALNLYGDPNKPDEYKPFPDIGDYVREDGLLMCLRSYDTELAVVEQSRTAVRQENTFFDRGTYVPAGRGRVVDIRIQHDDHSPSSTPIGMDAQPEKYNRARREFYQAILDQYNQLHRERKDGLKISPEYHRMLVEAIGAVEKDPQRIIKLYRQAPLDDWRVEFVIEYEITPTIGFKLTDCHGGKGVICYIAEPDEMPVDEDGNRADIMMDALSTNSRMNLGRLYEQYINAASRDVSKRLCQLLGVKKGDSRALGVISGLESNADGRFEQAWAYLMSYYQIVSPKMYVWMTSGEYKDSRAAHLSRIISEVDGTAWERDPQNPQAFQEVPQHFLKMYYPPENPPDQENMIAELETKHRPTYGPVTYKGYSGRVVTTKNPARIGSVYMILLEKIGDDWTAVSSGKTQHFGVLSQVTNADKFATPTRQQAIRAWGEAEVRIAVSYVGPWFVAEMLDRNNNADTHEEILMNLLKSDQPTNVHSLVNRKKIPLGGSKPLKLIKHIAECGGWRFAYKPHVPSWQQPGWAPPTDLRIQPQGSPVVTI